MSFTFCLFFAQFVTTAHFSPSIDYCWGKISLRGPNDTLTKFVQYLQSIMLNKKKYESIFCSLHQCLATASFLGCRCAKLRFAKFAIDGNRRARQARNKESKRD